eukprot:338024-Chlamydomonas_euryale.AAC.1
MAAVGASLQTTPSADFNDITFSLRPVATITRRKATALYLLVSGSVGQYTLQRGLRAGWQDTIQHWCKLIFWECWSSAHAAYWQC